MSKEYMSTFSDATWRKVIEEYDSIELRVIMNVTKPLFILNKTCDLLKVDNGIQIHTESGNVIDVSIEEVKEWLERNHVNHGTKIIDNEKETLNE